MDKRKHKMKNEKRKIEKLKTILKKLKSVVVAYSGGVDSTFLLKVAKEALGKDNVLAVTARSEVFPASELKDAKTFANRLGMAHMIIRSYELQNKKFAKNPVNRCYYCKKELFTHLMKIAKNKRLNHVVDGTNFDDLKDLRFGRKAALELGVKSPLMEAGLGKQNIRNLSKEMRLPTWNKSAFACLASRFPYHSTISRNKLQQIEELEDFLKFSLGFKQVRVRMYKNLARIEVGAGEISRFAKEKVRKAVVDKFKGLNCVYITLDLAGYRGGSMNEVL